MKKLLLSCALFSCFQLIAQVSWKTLPDIPVNPSAGSVSAEAGDLIITDDGNIYTAYMWDNGAGLKLYIAQYTQAAGWTPLYNQTCYDGMQSIHSRKVGNTAYFLTRPGNASGLPVHQVYAANQAGVNVISSFQLSDIQGGIDFEISQNNQYGFLCFKNANGTNLTLSQLEFSTSQLITQTLSIPGSSSVGSYDMTTAGDSAFVVISTVTASNKLFLYKAGIGLTVLLPWNGSASTGELLNGASPITCHNPMINSDGSGKIFLLGYDQGNIAGVEKMYENGVITNYPYSGQLAEYYKRGDAVQTPQQVFYINNFSPSNAPPYKTYVAGRDLSDGLYDTIGAPASYVLSNTQPTEHRLGLSTQRKRFTASFFEAGPGKHVRFISNNAPEAGNIDAPSGMCELQAGTIYNSIGFIDQNSDPVTIVEVLSSDISVLDPANIGFSTLGMNGNSSDYFVYGTPAQAGSVILTFKVTDGWDTVSLQMPVINVISPSPPVFSAPTLHMCSGNGAIDLYDYVSITGGTFYINALELTFEDGIFQSDDSPLNANSPETLTYDYFDGYCQYSIEADIVYNISPNVNISTTSSICGQSTGTATALVSGGATPYTFSQWSSGQQNTMNVNSLASGQYAFSITDANTCVVTEYFTVGSTGADLSGNITPVACNGQANGAISITPSGLVSPLVSLWSSGHSTLNLNNVPSGNYTLTVSDAIGCTVSKTFNVTQPAPLSSTVFITRPSCDQADGSLQVDQTTGGITPYSYAWSNGDSGPSSNGIAFGIYSLTTTDNNGCMSISTLYVSEDGSADLYGNVQATNCGSSDGSIDVSPFIPLGQTISYISWSNGATTEDIAQLAPATYVCTLELTNNCTAIKGWNVPVVKPLRNDICVVTVDSATTTNLVVWEKVQTTGISHYNIYRETSVQGQFALIDTVQATNLSLFNDVVASPLVRSWRYKIAAVNACGVTGPLSPAHQTIHLDVLDNGGSDVLVNWNAYEGSAFSAYTISRFTDATGWEEIATVPPTQLSYSDNISFTTAGLDYMVEIALDETCTALIWRAQDFNSARSNKDKGQFSAGEGTGDSNNALFELHSGTVEIYPNPFAGTLTIHLQESNEPMPLSIFSTTGQLLYETRFENGMHTLDLSWLKAGTYLLRTGSGGGSAPFIKL